jgi:hypothetical protein
LRDKNSPRPRCSGVAGVWSGVESLAQRLACPLWIHTIDTGTHTALAPKELRNKEVMAFVQVSRSPTSSTSWILVK